MLPFPIVKDFDVLEAGSFHFGMRYVANAMHPLVLEAVEPAFRRRIDAPMSRNLRRICQIGKNERI